MLNRMIRENPKNMKDETTDEWIVGKTIVLVVMILVVSIIAVASPVSASPASGSSGTDALHQQIRSLVSTANKDKAISLALTSPEFQSKAQGHSIKFHSIFTTWSAASNLRVDTLVRTSTNVVYYYNNQDDSSANIVVSIDPNLGRVTAVTSHLNAITNTTPKPCSPGRVGAYAVQPECGGGGTQTCSWAEFYYPVFSGYEFRTGCTQQTSPVYEATSTWTVPSAAEPWQNACDNHHCDISVWDGLTHDAGGGSGSSAYIVQAGTQSGVYCLFGGCSYFYSSWYEFWPRSPQSCGAINAGDVVTSDVINEAINGGSSSYWDIFLTDYGQGGKGSTVALCATTGNGFGVATPYYAQFFAERPQYCNLAGSCYDATLPKFSSNLGTVFYMNATMNRLNKASAVSGYTAYSTGWFTRYWMQNQNTLNIDPMSLSGDNSFSQIWLTSFGT